MSRLQFMYGSRWTQTRKGYKPCAKLWPDSPERPSVRQRWGPMTTPAQIGFANNCCLRLRISTSQLPHSSHEHRSHRDRPIIWKRKLQSINILAHTTFFHRYKSTACQIYMVSRLMASFRCCTSYENWICRNAWFLGISIGNLNSFTKEL